MAPQVVCEKDEAVIAVKISNLSNSRASWWIMGTVGKSFIEDMLNAVFCIDLLVGVVIQHGREEYHFSLRGLFLDILKFKFHYINHEFNLLISTIGLCCVECGGDLTVFCKEDTPRWVITLHMLGRVEKDLDGEREID